jgi:uncharacterized repeat protein (TIGR03803 family)
MDTTRVTRMLTPAGFAPAGKLGHLYGGLLPVLALCGVTALALPAQTFTTLHSFDGTDGSLPYAGLVQATNGDFYGTTCGFVCGASGPGTIFKMTPSGTLTTLYSFCSQTNCTDGDYPVAGLIQATNGDFYGTTELGGANGNYGTVFRMTPSGTLTTLYSFCSQTNCTDGFEPNAGLIQATNGELYGTTAVGGANGNYGTVFKITPSGTLTTLYSFCSQTNCTDGGYPDAGLIQATNGDFYGTTAGGGASFNGTVFKITPSGTLTTIHTFAGYPTDGSISTAGLIQATNGDFYGTASGGGANNDGTVFKITPSGTLTTLYSFCAQSGCTDGTGPTAALVQATNGTLYGTALGGGANGDGTVFSLSVGLGPFVETQTTAGEVGAVVKILGTNLTGATSVTFNGTAAVFTVSASSLITTTVPAGATTGEVQVVTPRRTLSSNVPFRVLP